MKKILVIFSVCAQLIFLPSISAKVTSRCHMCGMDAAKSQTEFVVYFDNENLEHTCCLHCVYLLHNFMKDHKILKLETRDFATGKFINAEEAYYLEESILIPKGSMAPFLLAFSDRETAGKYAKRYQGNVLGFKEAMDGVARFDEEVAPNNHKH